MKKIINFVRNEKGISAVEYAIIGALISVAIFLAFNELKGKFKTTTEVIGTNLDKAQEEQK